MATAAQIKALVRSHTDGNDELFQAVALQIAAQAARRGHGRIASELRDLIDQAKLETSLGSTAHPIPIASPRGELAGLLTVSYPDSRLPQMVLDTDTRSRLNRIVHEYRARGRIRSHGLSPRRKLLLVGPPGSGKTLTASALAGELQLPLFVLRLDGLITKYMGETASKLRLVFDSIEESTGLYLFDEFDSIGGNRADSNDVGEIRRVLNSFLLLIEQDDSDSVVVAATNQGTALDRALFRRFDDILEYGVPSSELAEKVLRNTLAGFDTTAVAWPDAREAASGLSYADITRAGEDAAKTAVLSQSSRIASEDLLAALDERRTSLD